MRPVGMAIMGMWLGWFAAAGVALGAPTTVSIDLSGLGGRDFELEISLYDNSPTKRDSWALIDNVTVGSVVDDFEGGTLGAWDASLNPASVTVVSGSLLGGGSYVLRIDEDPVFHPTIAFRDYLSPDGNVLTFDFEMYGSEAGGACGLDELVVSLLDPITLEPLVAGLSGFGDVLAVEADGLECSGEVAPGAPPAIPAPAAWLLSLTGIAGLGVWRKRVQA